MWSNNNNNNLEMLFYVYKYGIVRFVSAVLEMEKLEWVISTKVKKKNVKRSKENYPSALS